MNNITKTFDAIELLPIADLDTEPTSYLERFATSVAKANNAIVEVRATPENDAEFQRLISAATGDLKSGPVYRALPGANTPDAQAEVLPPIVVKSKQQLRTLYYLLHAGKDGIPITKFKHLAGAGNPGDPVSMLNKKVARRIIETTMYPVKNKTGKKTERGNYWLTADGKRIAAEILARAEYVHDPASDSRHLNRPVIVASEFIATYSLNADDLSVLRDGWLPQWFRLLYLLRAVNGAWVPRYVADELLDSENVCQVVRVAELELDAPAIDRDERTMLNRDDVECEYGLYRLADEWADKADKLIQEKLASATKAKK